MDWLIILENPNILNIFISIFSGLIVLTIERVFTYFIIPIYKQKSQKLPSFDGTEWLGYSDENGLSNQTNSTLKINQVGNKIEAVVVRSIKSGKRTFKYFGTMYGSQIIMEFFDKEGPGLIVGTMVLHIGSDLRTLRGASTYFHHDKGKVVSTFRTYRRQN